MGVGFGFTLCEWSETTICRAQFQKSLPNVNLPAYMYYRYYFLCCNCPKSNIENYLQVVKKVRNQTN